MKWSIDLRSISRSQLSKPAPGSLVSSENLTELGTQMAVGTKLQTNKMAGWFRIRQWKLSKE